MEPSVLDHAVSYLRAVRVSEDRYAWNISDGSYATVSEEMLATLVVSVEGMGANDFDAYQCWISYVDYTDMPFWWTPKTRFAWRIEGTTYDGSVRTEVLVYYDIVNYVANRYASATLVRITANLETGEEVPA